MKYYCEDSQQVLQELNSQKSGLTEKEAAERLLQNGANELKAAKGKSLLRRFAEQVADPMIVILLANVILSVGTPGIPGGAIASFAALATMAGLPAGVMGVYISINTLCDMGATCVNVIGDMAGCVVLKEKIKLDDSSHKTK